MNTIWSNYIQNIGTLYSSRTLRFSDKYEENYKRAFCIDKKQKFLEIGCGPGVLTQALTRWYPDAEIIGIDRDTAFIEFASQQAPHIKFIEADATALPFTNQSFDVTIFHTVQEHIEPSKFFKEQLRVLKPDGVCIVLSARRSICITADCIAEQSEFEKEIWNRVEQSCQNTNQKYQVGQYFLSESELPSVMEQYGFRQVSTSYLTVNLTPDNPENTKEKAYAMINAQYQTSMDAIDSISYITPDIVSKEEISKMKEQLKLKYKKRIELYDSNQKQWDTHIPLTMILRGIK